MALKLNNPIAILNIVEFVLNIIIAGLISDLRCLSCALAGEAFRTQFVDGIVFGYLIINVMVTVAIFIPGTLDKNLRLMISVAGAVLFGTVACLLLFFAVHEGWTHENYIKTLVAGIFSVILVFFFGLDLLYLSRFQDEEQETRFISSGVGSIFWLATAALILEAADTGLCQINEFQDSYDRSVAAGVLGLAVCITHAVETFFVYRNLID